MPLHIGYFCFLLAFCGIALYWTSEIVLFRKSGMGRTVAHVHRHTTAVVLRMRRDMPGLLIEARGICEEQKK